MDNETTPTIRDVPIGIEATGKRTESDSMGELEVPADRYWGAQTQRSLIHFSIGDDRMPKRGLPRLWLREKSGGAGQRSRRAAAEMEGGRASCRAADEVIAGKLDDAFPALCLADRVRHAVQHERQRGDRRTARSSCSAARSAARSRCTRTTTSTWASRRTTRFPTAMHIAAVLEIERAPAARSSRRCADRDRGQGATSGWTWSRSAAPICRTRCR